MMSRCYYENSVEQFCREPDSSILGKLSNFHQFSLVEQQRNSWIEQISTLKVWLRGADGHISFEYSIPRMGKRIDCIVLSGSAVFAIEFKVGSDRYDRSAIDQVMDYALDLKNFHEQSHHRTIIPILICTQAQMESFQIHLDEDGIAAPILTNGSSLEEVISRTHRIIDGPPIQADEWLNSAYKPTPTIIEAAQALYKRHKVDDISRSDAGAINLTRTADAISKIIHESKVHHRKSICFLTGVPGSGKTLAGLNLANSWRGEDGAEHAVFLSGNGPLVEVLREALARYDVEAAREKDERKSKSQALREAREFIQNIHHFRDDAIERLNPPSERVVVFDEAQRAWTRGQTAAFMKIKRGIINFPFSEPEFLIGIMDRHKDWATIICLVGGGQEINKGEAGLHEWFSSLRRSFSSWDIYISGKLTDFEYTRGTPLYSENEQERVKIIDELHLAVSIRSFRSEKVSAFVKALLDNNRQSAEALYLDLMDSYPILLTRNLDAAKEWLRSKARGSERYGLVSSSGAIRLRPDGINVKYSIEPKNWFLNGKDDIRSSYFLEEVATEFDIQGLELDWVCVGWDADLRHTGKDWSYKAFRGTHWQDIRDPEARTYLINSYRVLLTRARQGMVIFIPEGSSKDKTRLPEFYDSTYRYLNSIGILDL
jgi:hypothetical protein